jgi:hypothetical protein
VGVLPIHQFCHLHQLTIFHRGIIVKLQGATCCICKMQTAPEAGMAVRSCLATIRLHFPALTALCFRGFL